MPFLFGKSSDIETREPSSLNTDDASMASRGLMTRACFDGAPDILVESPHPQSANTLVLLLLLLLHRVVEATGKNA